MSGATQPAKRVAILGLGLMGGSLGMAIRESGMAAAVRGFARRARTRRQALRMKAVDEVFDTPGEAVEGADLVVLCVPVLALPGLVEGFRMRLAQGAVVTDVGSTKAEIAARAAALFRGMPVAFVGSHPMAGSDQAGIAAARPDLYDGALVVVTPTMDTPRRATARVGAFWRTLGCRVVRMTPTEHDRVIARTSHLPHLVAAALVRSVLGGRQKGAAEFCGPGFRDTTRIAGGSEDVWHDIVKSNRRFVLQELDAFAGRLARVRAMIKRGDFDDVRAFLAEARRRRQGCERRPGGKRRRA
jgi:prephenate dehydrogenase